MVLTKYLLKSIKEFNKDYKEEINKNNQPKKQPKDKT